MTSYSTISATGNDNPTLAFNLSRITDWNSASQFLDQMKMMRQWLVHEDGVWGGGSLSEAIEAGIFDENGWPTEIPEGVDGIGTVFDWTTSSTADAALAEQRAGVYIVEYEGEGTLKLQGDVTILSNEDGKIVFENVSGNSWTLTITETDPEGTGDYIRDVTVVAEENYDLFQAGAVYNPDWINLIDNARQLRFMDWLNTNSSTAVTVEDLKISTDERGLTTDASLEDMVRLANEVGADPWFSIPYLADESYIRAFAEYVRDNLDPDLVVRVEYSNEAWNTDYAVNAWLAEQALSEWGLTGQEAKDAYYVKMASQVAQIWEEVFGEEADDRLVNVLSGQANNTWRTARLLEASAWAENEPDAYVDPSELFEEFAITNYFGTNPLQTTAGRTAVLDLLQTQGTQAAIDYIVALTMDPSQSYSIPTLAAAWAKQAELAHDAGLELVAYEGGQHLFSWFSTTGLSADERTLLIDFMAELVRTPEMAEMYQTAFDLWSAVSDGPFMQYQEASTVTAYGSWGLYANLSDSNERADLLTELNEISDTWWEATGGTQYLQGIVARGTAEDDILIGTDQEDYLIGGDGDDTFVGGAGNDGINGGEGTDRLILSGNFADYTITAEGDGVYLVEGADGLDYIRDVEELQFDDTVVGLDVEIAAAEPDLVAAALVEEAGSTAVNEPLADETEVVATENILDLSDLTEGQSISAINRYSALGKELGLQDSQNYFYAERGSTATVDGQEFGISYWTTNENSLDSGKVALTSSALITAQMLGDVALDVDQVIGSQGADSFNMRSADDVVYGGAGNDTINTSDGNDFVDGGADNDWIQGGGGNDTLLGGDGADGLVGGTGDDLLTGGAGVDQFIFDQGTGQDTITDFTDEDILILRDFMEGVSDLASALSETDEGLLLSNGTDSILFAGCSLEDADWIFE
ncbi:calcium-binding protein (plasmid) [Thioclava litoralis]|uniref:Calcium-binding protein n=1 Tax=Thioclava litoralis TaxID=3076557 RepID=A0ABZ1E3L0_9RHOB|nr:calcium-binding protein [Thioclava sp. FTW29]